MAKKSSSCSGKAAMMAPPRLTLKSGNPKRGGKNLKPHK